MAAAGQPSGVQVDHPEETGGTGESGTDARGSGRRRTSASATGGGGPAPDHGLALSPDPTGSRGHVPAAGKDQMFINHIGLLCECPNAA